MKRAIFFFLLSLALPAAAVPPECDMRRFPNFWADAQSLVENLKTALLKLERSNPYSSASAKPFLQSLGLCEAKRKADFNDPNGNGGTVTQMKCEATLICSRLAVIENVDIAKKQTEQVEKMKSCNTEASSKSLQGAERKTFMQQCLQS